MSAPRRVLPGTTYLVTRKSAQGQFLLRPARVVNQTFLFVLAVAARRFGIRVHLFCVLSNHFHLLLTDPKARLPAFMQFLDSFVARAMNALLDRREAFWAPGSYSAVALATPEDILRKAVYVLANPVAAGLVRKGHLWPGLWSAPEAVGAEPIAVDRPRHFFDEEGELPEKETLRLRVPPGFASAEEFRAQLCAALEEREAELARRLLDFLGAKKVLEQRPTDRPKRMQPRRHLNPRVAARDKWRRIEVLGRLVEFLRSYRDAWLDWKAGKRNVVFPAGTYQLRVQHGVACAGAG